jgi:hypothetical protein
MSCHVTRNRLSTARNCAGGQYTSAGRWWALSRARNTLSFRLANAFLLAPTGVRRRCGFGDKATREGNKTAIVSPPRLRSGWDFCRCSPAFSSLCFWDHWKAIYPCVVRLIFGRVSLFVISFSLLAHAFYGICYFSLYNLSKSMIS